MRPFILYCIDLLIKVPFPCPFWSTLTLLAPCLFFKRILVLAAFSDVPSPLPQWGGETATQAK